MEVRGPCGGERPVSPRGTPASRVRRRTAAEGRGWESESVEAWEGESGETEGGDRRSKLLCGAARLQGEEGGRVRGWESGEWRVRGRGSCNGGSCLLRCTNACHDGTSRLRFRLPHPPTLHSLTILSVCGAAQIERRRDPPTLPPSTLPPSHSSPSTLSLSTLPPSHSSPSTLSLSTLPPSHPPTLPPSSRPGDVPRATRGSRAGQAMAACSYGTRNWG